MTDELKVELPPLPADSYSLWLQHGHVVNCFTHGVGDPSVWDHDKHWERKGYSRAPLYTAEQVRQAQHEAYELGRRDAAPLERSVEQEAQIRYTVEKLRAAEYFEARVQRLQALIEQGHIFDWLHTDAFDDGGAAYHEAKRRIAAKGCPTS